MASQEEKGELESRTLRSPHLYEEPVVTRPMASQEERGELESRSLSHTCLKSQVSLRRVREASQEERGELESRS